MLEKINIRFGTPEDFSDALKLIQELADYENASNEVENTVGLMVDEQSDFQLVVAEMDNKVIGIAIYFPYYSTWKGSCLYLEDIVVSESYRRKGIGRLLFDFVAKEARAKNAKRLMWQVLDWNTPAIKFYEKLNANLDAEWINCKLTKDQLSLY